ncbi:MAG: tyrosine-protein phosphatase, partial [Acidobacteriota bacterium]|nr:tyrosine-protein phosphatase [Acidobacteriota bacterium]
VHGLGVVVVLLAVVMAGCSRAPETASAVPETQPVTHERHVALDGQPNFRDVGGYETTDGRIVKWGEVYRSGELPRLSDKDVAKLDDMDIRTVVSFLTEKEIEARGPDRLPAGTVEVPLPMEAGNLGNLTDVVRQARSTGDFSQVPPDINPDIHRRLMVEAQEHYAALLREISDPASRPLVFHCSHGIHRTGTATAILLSALGVPWETVREDYLLSNTYRQEEIDHRLAQLRDLYAENNGISPDDVDTTNMDAFYILQGAYIDAALEQAVEDYGSMEAFIREGLGLSDEEIEKLQEQLLD